MQDKFASELRRAVFNWYYSGENADPEPIFNALAVGMEHDMQVLVPIEVPEVIQKKIGNPEEIQLGDIFIDETISIKFGHIVVDDDGKYLIPAFTGNTELNKGEAASVIRQPLKALLHAVDGWPDCLGFLLDPWDKKLMIGRDMIKAADAYKPKSYISIVKGSVVDMHVGAIVNAANQTLLGGGGVDGAIHRAAGPMLLKECRTLHGCRTGEAKITGAYQIRHADHIIHTVGPVYRGVVQDARLLSACYKNSLDLALENGCTSIAFPGISTGVYGYPINEAAKISYLTTAEWLASHPDLVMNVYFNCFRDAELEAYERVI